MVLFGSVQGAKRILSSFASFAYDSKYSVLRCTNSETEANGPNFFTWYIDSTPMVMITWASWPACSLFTAKWEVCWCLGKILFKKTICGNVLGRGQTVKRFAWPMVFWLPLRPQLHYARAMSSRFDFRAVIRFCPAVTPSAAPWFSSRSSQLHWNATAAPSQICFAFVLWNSRKNRFRSVIFKISMITLCRCVSSSERHDFQDDLRSVLYPLSRHSVLYWPTQV